MNLRIMGLGGMLGLVVVLFSELLVIFWTGEAVFNEPNKTILLGEMVLIIGFMVFTSLLLVEEIKAGRKGFKIPKIKHLNIFHDKYSNPVVMKWLKRK